MILNIFHIDTIFNNFSYEVYYTLNERYFYSNMEAILELEMQHETKIELLVFSSLCAN